MSDFPYRRCELPWQLPPVCAVCGFDILDEGIELPLDKSEGPRYRHPDCVLPKNN